MRVPRATLARDGPKEEKRVPNAVDHLPVRRNASKVPRNGVLYCLHSGEECPVQTFVSETEIDRNIA